MLVYFEELLRENFRNGRMYSVLMIETQTFSY